MPQARPRKPKPARAGRVTFETVCKLGLALPGGEESTSYGTPSLKVAGKFLCRLKEDGDTLALRIGFEQRSILMEEDPETFFVTRLLKDTLPTPSVAEDRWLSAELEARSLARSVQAQQSVAFAKRELQSILVERLQRLEQLVGKHTCSLRNEVLLWALVAENYRDHRFAVMMTDILKRELIDPDQALPSTPRVLFDAQYSSSICGEILDSIVIPYLRRDLRKVGA